VGQSEKKMKNEAKIITAAATSIGSLRAAVAIATAIQSRHWHTLSYP
jgi:hypothetical protein